MKNLKNKLFIIFSLLCALALTSCMDLYDNYDLCTVVFNGNGGATVAGVTSYNQISKQGEVAKLTPNSFISEGKLFLGWSENKDATTADYLNEAEFPFGSDKTLYAIWAPGIFTVTFDGNGVTLPDGSKTYTQEFKYGVTQKLINNQFPESETKGFAGWALSKDAKKADYPNGNTMSFDKDTTLYAVWSNVYYITFDPNEGSGSMVKQKFTEGVEQNISPNLFTKTADDFSGWSRQKLPKDSPHEYDNGAKIVLDSTTGSITLYAVWVTGSRQLFVSDNGNDNNTGSSESPFKHLQAAITRITSAASINDDWEVNIRGTVYGNTEIAAFKAKKLTIQKDGTDPAVLSGSSGTDSSSVLTVSDKSDIVIKDVSISGGSGTKGTDGLFYGGGIYLKHADAKLTLETNSVITGNSAARGAGIYVESGTLNLAGGEISSNTGATNGGGVYMSGGEFNLNSGTIKSHNATNGGGVYVSGGTFNLNAGNIGVSGDGNGNTATNGGGLYIAGGVVTMGDGTISYNKASSSGGGVYIASQKFSMTGGCIENNLAAGAETTNGGGGIYNESEFILKGASVIRNNKAKSSDDKKGKGGGVYNKGTFIMSGSALIGDSTESYPTGEASGSNYASDIGGGIFNDSAAVKFEMKESAKIAHNYSKSYGGGLFNDVTDLNKVTYIVANIAYNNTKIDDTTDEAQIGGNK